MKNAVKVVASFEVGGVLEVKSIDLDENLFAIGIYEQERNELRPKNVFIN